MGRGEYTVGDANRVGRAVVRCETLRRVCGYKKTVIRLLCMRSPQIERSMKVDQERALFAFSQVSGSSTVSFLCHSASASTPSAD